MEKIKYLLSKRNVYGLFLVFLTLFILWHNSQAARFNCLNSSDLGIYAQALYEMAENFTFNPFLTVRGIKVFNDHFDPILHLVAPLTRLFSYQIEGVLLIEMLWLWATMGLLFRVFWKKGQKGLIPLEFLYFLSLLLFSKGLIVGLTYPVHPTVWAIFPCFLLVMSLQENKAGKIVASAFFICLFKEEFPFAILGLSFAFLVRRDWKKFFPLLAVAVLFILFDFVWRPLLLGKTYPHGNQIFNIFMKDPLLALWTYFIKIGWGPVSLFYPFLIPLAVLVHKEIRSFKAFLIHPLFPTLCFLLPLVVIRLLAQAFHFHYSAPLLVTLLALLALSSVPEEITRRPRWALVVLLLFVASSSGVYTKMVKFAFFNDSAKCRKEEGKWASTQKLQNLLLSVKNSETLLASGGVIPQILRPGVKYHHLGGLALKLPEYDYFLLEIGKAGDTWPLSPSQIQAVALVCRSYAQDILMEDEYYLFMKGKFPRDCLREGKKVW